MDTNDGNRRIDRLLKEYKDSNETLKKKKSDPVILGLYVLRERLDGVIKNIELGMPAKFSSMAIQLEIAMETLLVLGHTFLEGAFFDSLLNPGIKESSETILDGQQISLYDPLGNVPMVKIKYNSPYLWDPWLGKHLIKLSKLMGAILESKGDILKFFNTKNLSDFVVIKEKEIKIPLTTKELDLELSKRYGNLEARFVRNYLNNLWDKVHYLARNSTNWHPDPKRVKITGPGPDDSKLGYGLLMKKVNKKFKETYWVRMTGIFFTSPNSKVSKRYFYRKRRQSSKPHKGNSTHRT